MTAIARRGVVAAMADPRTLTLLLRDWRGGDQDALATLMSRVYSELEQLAASHLRAERPDHTFRPTDLVSEAFLRLSAGDKPDWQDRVHFFGVAARTMRQILVDHARKHSAGKRGDGLRPVPLDDQMVGSDRSEELIALDEALTALAAFDERKARAIELHYFGGLTHEEIGEAIGVHVNTVGRDLKLGEAWIHRRLTEAA